MPTDPPPPPIEIRSAAATDWLTVQALLQNLGLPLPGAREHLDEMLVAIQDGVVIACAGLERYGPDGLLRSVAVICPIGLVCRIGRRTCRRCISRYGLRRA